MMLELTHYGGVAPVKPLRINIQFLYRAGDSDPPPLSICIMSSRRPVAIETRLNGDIVNYLERTTADPFSCINCNIAVILILQGLQQQSHEPHAQENTSTAPLAINRLNCKG